MGNRTGKQSITKKLEQPKKPEQPKNLEQAKQSNNLSNQRADLPREKKKCQKQCVSQMIDLVMRIKTHTESSKSELSSGGKGPFKVYNKKSQLPKSASIIFLIRTVK